MMADREVEDQLSLLYGHPPKTVWLCVGNSSTSTTAELLGKHRATMERSNEDPDAVLLALTQQSCDDFVSAASRHSFSNIKRPVMDRARTTALARGSHSDQTSPDVCEHASRPHLRAPHWSTVA